MKSEIVSDNLHMYARTKRYVLTDSKGGLYPILFGGVQVTTERTHHAIDAKLQFLLLKRLLRNN